MKHAPPIRSLLPCAAMLACAVLPYVQAQQPNAVRPRETYVQPRPEWNGAQAGGGAYRAPGGYRHYGRGMGQAAPNQGYAPQPLRNPYDQPQRGNRRMQGRPYGAGVANPYNQAGEGNPYNQGQSGYRQPQRAYPQSQANANSGTGEYAQAPNPPGQQSVPNNNANYGGLNQQRMRPNAAQRFWRQQPDGIGPNGTRGEHLQQWMQQHNSLTSQDQQRALEREPGFNQLPQQTQQRMLERLQRLNSMPPGQRERTLQRSEQMERLSPAQRGQVRGAMGELGALPQDRRRAVARTFRELRPMPADQRNQLLNSPTYRQQFTDQERNTLNNLLSVSPMLPQQ